MDMITLDVTHISYELDQSGEPVDLDDSPHSLGVLAVEADTIDHMIATWTGRRNRRSHIEKGRQRGAAAS